MSEKEKPPRYKEAEERAKAVGYTLEWYPNLSTPYVLTKGGSAFYHVTSLPKLEELLASLESPSSHEGECIATGEPGGYQVVYKEEEILGSKADNGKSRLDLLDTDWLMGVGDVMAFGATKYEAHNWRKGIQVSRLVAAAMRHLTAFNKGEDFDQESGLHHLCHASACLMFAQWTSTQKPELDDRYKGVSNEIQTS